MANLMVATGMEDQFPGKKEYFKSIDENILRSQYMKIPPQFCKKKPLSPLEEVKELRQKIHAVDEEPAETRYMSRETIGAESARLGYEHVLKQNSGVKGNRINTEKDFKDLALSFASPAKKFLYKVLDMAGLFQPEKVIYREAKKVDEAISEFNKMKDKYTEKVKKLDKNIQELHGFVCDSDKVLSELEAKIKNNPAKKDILQQEIESASESFLDFYHELEEVKEDRMNARQILHAIKDQIKYCRLSKSLLYGEAKSSYNQNELKKVLEAYENI